MRRFEDKVVMVTGGIGGLGLEWLKAFAQEGALLAINHMDTPDIRSQAEDTASALKEQFGARSRCYAADVTSESEICDMFTQITEDFGRIDALVCGAGIMLPALSWKIPLSLWQKTLDINLTGSFLCARQALEQMRKQRYGRIVFVSSVGAISGVPVNAAYCAAKAGMTGFMKAAVREVSRSNITINCVAPGFVATGVMEGVNRDYFNNELLPLIPMGRTGNAEEVAKAVVFLASDDASYITGETLRVDGGYSL